MTSSTNVHLVIPDPHALPNTDLSRADLLAKLIKDVKPTTVIDLGDTADMPSMSSYDRNTKSFHGRSYAADIEAHAEFQERLWRPVFRTKKKLPRRVRLIGNHDYRIWRAIEMQPELEGERFGVSPRDLDLDTYYTDVVEYNGGTPGVIDIDGVHYAHFLVSGVKGLAISGEHQANSLLSKMFVSCTVGHTHTMDYSTRVRADGKRIMGLVAGVFQDHFSKFAGESNKLWWKGVVIKRQVEDGTYDPEFVSMDRLKREYG